MTSRPDPTKSSTWLLIGLCIFAVLFAVTYLLIGDTQYPGKPYLHNGCWEQTYDNVWGQSVRVERSCE